MLFAERTVTTVSIQKKQVPSRELQRCSAPSAGVCSPRSSAWPCLVKVAKDHGMFPRWKARDEGQHGARARCIGATLANNARFELQRAAQD
eukprot:4550641-Pyramimonas_sp.AAC.1